MRDFIHEEIMKFTGQKNNTYECPACGSSLEPHDIVYVDMNETYACENCAIIDDTGTYGKGDCVCLEDSNYGYVVKTNELYPYSVPGTIIGCGGCTEQTRAYEAYDLNLEDN